MRHLVLFEEFTFNDIYKVKNRWITLRDNNDLEEIKNNLYVLVDNAYSKLGGNVSIKDPDDVIKRDYWEAIDLNDNPDADAVIFGKKTKHGIKISGIGHDGEKKSKLDLLHRLVETLKKKGYFIEASGKLKEHLKRYNINSIKDKEILQDIFPNVEIEMMDDGEYRRELTDGGKTDVEKLFGNPLI